MTTRQDAVDLLKADHLEVAGLFEAFRSLCGRDASEIEKSSVIERVCLLLSIRAQVDEEIVFPAVRKTHIDLMALGARIQQRKKELMAEHRHMTGRSGREDESADPVGGQPKQQRLNDPR